MGFRKNKERTAMKAKSIQSHTCQVYFRHACEVEIFTALSEDDYYISFAKVADDIVKAKGDLSASLL